MHFVSRYIMLSEENDEKREDFIKKGSEDEFPIIQLLLDNKTLE